MEQVSLTTLGALRTGARALDWQRRLSIIVDMMREMSSQEDPQAMVRDYIERMRQLRQTDRMVAVSRRGLDAPLYRITRSDLWPEDVNPWQEAARLPLLQGGLLGELIYGDRPRIIDKISIDPADPAAEYFAGLRSLVAIPQYDHGVALNMVVLLRKEPAAFDREQFPEMVWMSNLFGRATLNLVLSEKLKRAYQVADREMQVISDIQRALLPANLPDIPTMQLAVDYQTSRQAGGDYYDFFPLPDGRWGMLIADVSGHGTPAAVVMAIVHSIAHTYPGPPAPPSRFLEYLNNHLVRRYTFNNGTFVTAFYGVYDPRDRSLTYASAGHNPPRVKHCGGDEIAILEGAQVPPLGILTHFEEVECTHQLQPSDQLIFYTDGITEAFNAEGEMFGPQRLDRVLADCSQDANQLIESVLRAVDAFCGDLPAQDDRTLLVAKIT